METIKKLPPLLLVLSFAIAVYPLDATKSRTWYKRQEQALSESPPHFVGLKATKPHIMMMLVDDWGWANVGYHRNASDPEIVTPNFDKLLKEGLELNQN